MLWHKRLPTTTHLSGIMAGFMVVSIALVPYLGGTIQGLLLIGHIAVSSWLIVKLVKRFTAFLALSGWFITVVLVAFSTALVDTSGQASFAYPGYIAKIALLPTLVFAAISSVRFGWLDERSMAVAASLVLIGLWSMAITWATHDDMLAMMLGTTRPTSNLWWLTVISWLVIWTVPSAVLGYLVRSVKLINEELA